jgi:hypothetical protein
MAIVRSGEVLMEPGGAPSELSLAISGCRSSFGHRGPCEAYRYEVFQGLLPFGGEISKQRAEIGMR